MALDPRKKTLLCDMSLAETTKITYRTYFKKLFEFCKNISEKDYVWYVSNKDKLFTTKVETDFMENFLEISDDSLQILMENLLDYEKKRSDAGEISPNTVPKYFKAYRTLLTANYRENAVQWGAMAFKFPLKEKKSGFKPWSTLQIDMMLEKCDNFKKEAIVLFESSTGCRVGIHNHPLLLKHIIKMDNSDLEKLRQAGIPDIPDYPYDYHCYAVLVYGEDDETVEEKDQRLLNDEYDDEDYSWFVFLNPEAAQALDKYHQQRKDNGETFVSDTPLFLGAETRTSVVNKNFYQFSGNAFRHLMESLTKRANIHRTKKKNRHSIMLDHGYRKRFATILKLNKQINPNIAEALMQHKKGLDGAYLAPRRDECFPEFVKAIPELTVRKAERQKYVVISKDEEITSLKKDTIELAEIRKQNDLLKSKAKFYEDTLEEYEPVFKRLKEEQEKKSKK